MRQYEYKVETLPSGADYQEYLDQLGNAGWELVAVTLNANMNTNTFYLKRQKRRN